MKHTSGNWIVSQVSEFEIDVIDEKHKKTIATVIDWNEQRANANLIASAPELLAFTQKWIAFRNGEDIDPKELWFMATQAVAKAEDEQ